MDKLIWVSILISGGDRFSIRFLDSTFKLNQLTFLFCFFYFIFFKKYYFSKKIMLYFSPIIGIHFLSLFHTVSFIKSFIFFLFIIFNYLIVIGTVYSWCRYENNEKIINKYIQNFRVVGILSVIQFILGSFGITFSIFQNDIHQGIYRPALWFYEPSYLATYLCFYYIMTLVFFSNNKKKYKKDLFFSILVICITTSTLGYLVLFSGILLYIFFLNKNIFQGIKKIWDLIKGMIIGIVLVYLWKKEIILIFIGRIFKIGIKKASGRRIDNWGETLEVIKANSLFGIGANSYGVYTQTNNPPSNVTLEILATLGIVGLFCFIVFLIFIFLNCWKLKKDINIKAMWLSLVIALIALQANQNYMRTYFWVHIAILFGIIANHKRENRTNSCRKG